MTSEDLTEAQNEAVEKAWALMREHFDGAVLIFDTETKDGNDTLFGVNYQGGVNRSIGLTQRANFRLMKMVESEAEES
jgi:hypothetical protein